MNENEARTVAQDWVGSREELVDFLKEFHNLLGYRFPKGFGLRPEQSSGKEFLNFAHRQDLFNPRTWFFGRDGQVNGMLPSGIMSTQGILSERGRYLLAFLEA